VEWLKHTYLVPVVSVVVENGDIITWYTWSPTYEDVHLKNKTIVGVFAMSWAGFEHIIFVVIGTNCIGSCKNLIQFFVKYNYILRGATMKWIAGNFGGIDDHSKFQSHPKGFI
jgi:hypothetical protein